MQNFEELQADKLKWKLNHDEELVTKMNYMQDNILASSHLIHSSMGELNRAINAAGTTLSSAINAFNQLNSTKFMENVNILVWFNKCITSIGCRRFGRGRAEGRNWKDELDCTWYESEFCKRHVVREREDYICIGISNCRNYLEKEETRSWRRWWRGGRGQRACQKACQSRVLRRKLVYQATFCYWDAGVYIASIRRYC